MTSPRKQPPPQKHLLDHEIALRLQRQFDRETKEDTSINHEVALRRFLDNAFFAPIGPPQHSNTNTTPTNKKRGSSDSAPDAYHSTSGQSHNVQSYRHNPLSTSKKKSFQESKLSEAKRYDSTAKFVRTGDAKADNQFFINEFQSIVSSAESSAKKNGAFYLIVGSDSTTRAHIELNGGTVEKNACMMKLVGPNMPHSKEQKAKLQTIWHKWLELSEVIVIDKKESIQRQKELNKKQLQKQTGNIAERQKKLLDALLKREIGQNEYAQRMKALTGSLMKTATQ